MTNRHVLILVVLIGVIYNSAHEVSACDIKYGFNIFKLEGLWHFIAGIYPERTSVSCAHISLNQISKHRFVGKLIATINGEPRKWSIQSYVRNGMFALRYHDHNYELEEVLLMMKTCNEDIEISLEIPKHNLYFVFARSLTISPEFLDLYRSIGFSTGIMLQHANNTGCPEVVIRDV